MNMIAVFKRYKPDLLSSPVSGKYCCARGGFTTRCMCCTCLIQSWSPQTTQNIALNNSISNTSGSAVLYFDNTKRCEY